MLTHGPPPQCPLTGYVGHYILAANVLALGYGRLPLADAHRLAAAIRISAGHGQMAITAYLRTVVFRSLLRLRVGMSASGRLRTRIAIAVVHEALGCHSGEAL